VVRTSRQLVGQTADVLRTQDQDQVTRTDPLVQFGCNLGKVLAKLGVAT